MVVFLWYFFIHIYGWFSNLPTHPIPLYLLKLIIIILNIKYLWKSGKANPAKGYYFNLELFTLAIDYDELPPEPITI